MENINTIYSKRAENDRDHYLDFDMFDYVYSLVCTIDDYSRVLNPTNKTLKKFDSDKDGDCHVYTDGNSSIILDTANKKDFEGLIAVCDLYKIEHTEPTLCRDYNRDYYQVIVEVPTISPSYPMLLEDYFESIGVSLDEVMPQKWLTHYRSKLSKIAAESEEMIKEAEAEKVYQKHVTEAWRRGDIELAEHFQSLIDELKSKDLPCKKNILRKRFLAEFGDAEPDDEDTIPQLKEVELF